MNGLFDKIMVRIKGISGDFTWQLGRHMDSGAKIYKIFS